MNKLFTKIATLVLGMTMAVGVGVAVGTSNKNFSQVNAATAGTYKKVTSTSGVAAGDEVIILNHSGNRALATLSTTSTVYGYYTAIVTSNNSVTLDGTEKVASFTVQTGSVDGTFSFQGNSSNPTSSGQNNDSTKNAQITNYLYWTSGNSLNQGSSGNEICWALSYTDDGMSMINQADSANPKTRMLRYNGNTNSERFATYAKNKNGSYANGVEMVDIYKKQSASSDTIDSFNVTATPTYSRTATPAVSGWTVTANLHDKATPVAITSGLTFTTTPSTDTVGTINVSLTYTAASGDYPLTNGDATATIATTMTVNPQQASVTFKQDSFVVAPNGTLTLADEITQSGDGDLTFSITSGSEYVSITDGVLTANALGTATIKVVKQYGSYSAFKAEDTASIEVSNVKTWSYTFSQKTIESSPANVTLNSRAWTVTNNGDYYGYDGTKGGQQIGSGSYPAKSLTFESEAFAAYSGIKTVKVKTNSAGSGAVSLSVRVGDTDYKYGTDTSVTISDSTSTEYAFQSTTNDLGKITISWSQSTSKAIYIKAIEVTYDNAPITQTGIKASWASGKGSYYNGSKTDTTTFRTNDLIINTTTGDGQIYGDANTTGIGFKTYLKNSDGKWVKTDKTTSETEVAFIDSTSALGTQAMTGFEAGSYTLYVTTAKDGGGVWTSDPIAFTVIAKAPDTITRASEPTKTEFVAYVDEFAAFEGKINVSYNDESNDNNRTPVIKYYDGNNEINIATLLNNNKFAVNTNTTLTVRLYDEEYVGGDYVYNSYSLYVYVGTFTCTDGNGEGAEYESGGTVTLNPTPKITYTDKTSTAQVLDLTASDVDLYIKLKGASGDGEIYSGTLPEVNESTQYTITAIYKGNASYKASYDITIVNATFSIDASGATKTYAFGTNFTKAGLVVQIQYGSADPITIAPENYTCEDENGNVLDVIKFIGKRTVTVRYKGYSATYQITGTNVGSSETYVHDDIPGEWTAGEGEYVTYQSASDTCTTKGELLEADGFDYATVTGNNTYKALLNGSSVIGKNVAFNDKVVKSLTLSFNAKTTSAAGDASFAFTVAAIVNDENHTVSTTYVVTSQSYKLTTTSQTISLTLDNMAYTDNITGWYLTVSKTGGSSSAPNAQFYSLRVDYTPYVKGPDQTFNATPFEQALVYSNYFLEITSEYCTVALTDDIKSLLATEYAGMVDEAETIFKTAEIVRGKDQKYENAISEALSRYVNMVEQFETGDFLNLGDEVINQHVPVNPLFNGENSNMVAIVVIVSVVSLTAIGGYFFLKKRREQN